MKKKKIWKILGGVLGILLALVVIILGAFTALEYRPDAMETVQVASGDEKLEPGEEVSILSWNIGYGALDKDSDFFMDGGTKVNAESEEAVEANLGGIADVLKQQDADAYFFQEVDLDSKRSFEINEQEYLENELNIPGMFAYNFKCAYVPYPIPTIGKVNSGLLTMSDYKVSEATRISLPESFSWPVKTCNLKRCMLETRIPIEGTDQELVLINFHLEAYDSGAGKIAQSKMLADKLQAEYDKGNYVIAGGDFNQTFEGLEAFPKVDEENWQPGVIGKDDIPDNFCFAVSNQVPTCRLLNEPYSGNYEESQVYVIDGFIISNNLTLESVENIDTDFQYTDHQPVKLKVRLD